MVANPQDTGGGPLGAAHVSGTRGVRAVQVEENILSANNLMASANRNAFESRKILALNLVSSPGAGKTSLLTRTLLAKRVKAGVIEGDQSTSFDAERIRETGAPAVQINTGKACHLDAHKVGQAMAALDVESGAFDGGVVFIENVGNLVCPAAFDLGEAAKVVLLSVTEGDDKPAKYPDMFAASKLMIVTKKDLLAHVDFDVDRCFYFARKINPQIEMMVLSSKTGEGMESWFSWLARGAVAP